MVDQRTFTVPELAKMLRVSERTIYNMIGDGRLEAMKAGRSYLVTRSHLVDYAGSEGAADDLVAALEAKGSAGN